MVSASSWSCVTMMVVTPSVRCSALISCRRRSRTRASSADRGSSSSSRPGEVASARARAMRCCWPPESCAGYFGPASGMPTRVSSSFDPLGDRAARLAAAHQPVADIVGHGEVGKERVGLEDDAEVALRRRQRRDVPPLLADRAGGLRIESGDGAQQGRLAAARGPEEADELALADIERDIAEGGEVAEALLEVADLEVIIRHRKAPAALFLPRSHGGGGPQGRRGKAAGTAVRRFQI